MRDGFILCFVGMSLAAGLVAMWRLAYVLFG